MTTKPTQRSRNWLPVTAATKHPKVFPAGSLKYRLYLGKRQEKGRRKKMSLALAPFPRKLRMGILKDGILKRRRPTWNERIKM